METQVAHESQDSFLELFLVVLFGASVHIEPSVHVKRAQVLWRHFEHVRRFRHSTRAKRRCARGTSSRRTTTSTTSTRRRCAPRQTHTHTHMHKHTRAHTHTHTHTHATHGCMHRTREHMYTERRATQKPMKLQYRIFIVLCHTFGRRVHSGEFHLCCVCVYTCVWCVCVSVRDQTRAPCESARMRVCVCVKRVCGVCV